jgi:modulator of FtsH protease
MSGWENFFISQVSASAALTGLIFVSVSINLPKIIAMPGLPGRAFEAVLVLVSVLIISSLLLIPNQSLTLIGLEVLTIGILAWGTNTSFQVSIWRQMEAKYHRRFIQQITLNQVATLLLVVSGVLILTIGASGVYWLVPGFILCILAALLDAWVLLIEINR